MNRFWAWIERFAISVVLLGCVTILSLFGNRIYEGASPEVTEPIAALLIAMAALALYLAVSATVGTFSHLAKSVSWVSTQREQAVDNFLSALAALALGVVFFGDPPSFTTSEALTSATIGVHAILVGKFVLYAIPFWYVNDRWDPLGVLRGVIAQ